MFTLYACLVNLISSILSKSSLTYATGTWCNKNVMTLMRLSTSIDTISVTLGQPLQMKILNISFSIQKFFEQFGDAHPLHQIKLCFTINIFVVKHKPTSVASAQLINKSLKSISSFVDSYCFSSGLMR